jgi:uncharacterized protein (DUF2252 family)
VGGHILLRGDSPVARTDPDNKTEGDIARAHPSAAERAEAGKAARKKVPRSSHGDWRPAKNRPDPVDVLERQAASRIARLIPLRHGRMLATPFTFLRGAAAIMAADLAASPDSGFSVQACGDAHLSNFGAFASPERRLVFDVNDFDETLPAPWEWDVKRLAASLAVGGRDRGWGPADRRRIVGAAVAEYREAMRELATNGNLDAWNTHLDVEAILERLSADVSKRQVKAFERNVAKARAKDSIRALKKLTHQVDGEVRIISDPPLIVPVDELVDSDEAGGRVREILERYRTTLSDARRYLFDGYRYVHAAMKVVGVGSVGTRAWIVLMLGRDDQDPLFLQVKEAQQSVLEPHIAPSRFSHHGERVVQGQRLMQAASDAFLGWVTATGIDGRDRDFYVRQLWDWKGSAQVDLMSRRGMVAYGQICGATLARAHAHSGDRIAIGAYLGGKPNFDEAISDFAETYADQNERDYEALIGAVDAGRIEVEREAG